MLIRTAARSLETVEKQEPGWFYDALIVMTFSALAIEALCNSVGQRVIKNWKDDFEPCPPIAKMRLLATHMSIPFDRKVEPWAGAAWLLSFRNLVAYAKPEIIRTEEIVTQEEYDKRLMETPESKLEKMTTVGNAKRAMRIADQIKDIFIQKIPLESTEGLALDSWHGSATVHKED